MAGHGLTLQDAYHIFYTDCRARRLAASTLRFYRVTLGLTFRHLDSQGVTLLGEVTAHHIRHFLTLRQDAGLATHTQHKYARSLRTFFRFCVREGLLTQNPMTNVTMPRVEKLLPTSFTDEEVTRILGECESERDRTICLVLLDTGLRASELLALNVGDVDIREGRIFVRHGKGAKQRAVFFGTKTRRQLLRLLDELDAKSAKAPLIVSTVTKGRLTLSGLFHLMTRLRKATGIEQLQAHTFRRTFALTALRNGMSIYHLQQLMGHEDLHVLRRYLGLVENDLASAHQAAGPVDRLLKR